MRNIVCRSGFIAGALLIGTNVVSAQEFGPAPPMSPMPVSSMNSAPAFKWDYRFDAQYNSTIKPYLRWYNRNGNRAPQNGVRYPYYSGPQPYYNGGTTGNGCDACGQPNYSQGYVQPQRSSWFNPTRHMNQTPVAGDHHGVRAYLSQSKPKTSTTTARKPFTQTRSAWVKLETSTNSATVMYQEPSESAKGGFTQALVTTTNGKLNRVKWIDEPSEKLATVFVRRIKQ